MLIMMSITCQNIKEKRQRKVNCKMEDKKEIIEEDFIKEGFSSDCAFKNLLKERLFADYLNTFLCLPVFSKRLLYRLDTGLFQVLSQSDCGHYSQEKLLSFVRKERGPLFLKTDICNEYRLCKLVLKNFKTFEENEEQLLDLKTVFGSVFSVQRMKAFLHNSIGENTVLFWLDAERYRRQTEPECLRFALKEIQDKYIIYGAWLEVQASIKSEFNASLKRESDSSIKSTKASEILVPCQDMAFSSLISYWLPKYLSHRSHKIKSMKTKKRADTQEDMASPTRYHEQLQYNVSDEKATLEPGYVKEPYLSFSPSSYQEDRSSQSRNVYRESPFEQRCSSATVKTLGNDTDETYSWKGDVSSTNSSMIKLPSLSKSSSYIIEKSGLSSSNLNQKTSETRLREAKSSPANKGKNFSIFCNESRGASPSKALLLANSVRNCANNYVQPQCAFFSGFYQHLIPKFENTLELLCAALTADQFASQPFCNFLQSINNQQAFANFRFWVAAQQFLSGCSQMDTLLRRRRAKALINLYMLHDSPRKTCIGRETLSKLVELLPHDLGYGELNMACWECANALLPFWKKFAELDERRFLKFIHSHPKTEVKLKPGNAKQKDRISDHPIINALRLAISISIPGASKPLMEGNEDENEIEIEEAEGSLFRRKLQVLNADAAKALENYRKNNLSQSSLAYYRYQQSMLLNGAASETEDVNCTTNLANEKLYRHARRTENKPKLTRPKCFQEVIHDPQHFEAFKQLLVSHKSETPLLFWQAVEYMRINTRETKQRHACANGILKKFFGKSTNYGKLLDCDADIVKDLSQMDKVTPPMLVSAQACITWSLEEKWFSKYLATFPEEEKSSDSELMPTILLSGESGFPFVRPLNQRSIFAEKSFMAFSESEMSGRRENRCYYFRKAAGVDETQNVMIRNRYIDTGKLLNDLRFWIEVGRYKDFADAVVLCAKLGNYMKEDELIVTQKANAIVECFIDSQIPPRIQINISPSIADTILHNVKGGFIERSLFHDAAFSVFSVLIHYWRRFCYYRIIPSASISESPSTVRTSRSLEIMRRLKSIHGHRVGNINLESDRETVTVMFSLEKGIRIVVSSLEEDENFESNKLPLVFSQVKMDKPYHT